ncbi:MAG: carboxypeptidase regulatory-like domain-containing protein [Candidatus Acidiferrales bacterium]
MSQRSFHLALASLLAVALIGCGSKESNQTAEQPAAPAAAGKTVDASTAGTVTGKVTLEGKPDREKAINMSAEPYCQKANPSPVIPPTVVVNDKGDLENVVIYVKDGLGDYVFTTPTAAVPLAQKDCMYSPHIIALMAGQNFEVKNEDQTTHNIHPMPKDNREWNKSQAPGTSPIDESFARPELAIPVKCNVHPWMKSYIFVFKNPYYAITGKDGSFELKDLPPGTYTIEAWQEKYGTQDQTVTIGPKESKSVDFKFNAAAPAAPPAD